ncbi:MAG: hypothetical protein ACK2UI_12315, partial [Anaerolineae bacterium]
HIHLEGIGVASGPDLVLSLAQNRGYLPLLGKVRGRQRLPIRSRLKVSWFKMLYRHQIQIRIGSRLDWTLRMPRDAFV